VQIPKKPIVPPACLLNGILDAEGLFEEIEPGTVRKQDSFMPSVATLNRRAFHIQYFFLFS